MYRAGLLLAVAATSFAAIGFDSDRKLDVAHFKCFAYNESASFYVGRLWKEDGRFDNQGIHNIRNSKVSGYAADGLFFPCLKPSCAHASNQFEAVINKLTTENITVDTIWIGISRSEWHDNHTINVQFTNDVLTQADKMKIPVGIHTHDTEYKKAFGNYTGFGTRPLWWIKHDNKPTLDNGFVGFGGWTKVAMHQYENEKDKFCGATIKMDFRQ